MTKKEEYQEYLKSDHWKIVREARKEYDGHRCVICGSKDNLNVHHLTYAHRGNEPLQDLITVCEDCHKMIHEHPKKPEWIREADEKKFCTLFHMSVVQSECMYWLCDFLWVQVGKMVGNDKYKLRKHLKHTKVMSKLHECGDGFGYLQAFREGMDDVWADESCHEEQGESDAEECDDDAKEEREVKHECSNATRALPGRPRYIA